MEPPAAAARPLHAAVSLSRHQAPVAAWLLGFLVIGLAAARNGGFDPATWAWTAFATWLLVAGTVAGRARSAVGRLDLAMAGGSLALAGWFALSALWSSSVPSTLDESFRLLAYAGLVAAALVVVERRTVPSLLGGVTVAISLLSLYALGTRLLPDRLGEFAPALGYRLAGTIGYWNGLGLFAVMGLLLALGFALRSERRPGRAAAGARLPVLAMTVVFTFSRGAWVALLVGLVAALVLDPRREQLALGAAMLGLGPAVGALLATRAPGLTETGASLEAATRDGHRLALVLVILVAVNGVLAGACRPGALRVRLPSRLRLVGPIALAAILLVGVGVAWARDGSPARIAQDAWSRAQALPQAEGNSARLLDLSADGRLELWRTAGEAFAADPVGGGGGGTFWQTWAGSRNARFPSTEAHSLYAETLAELGAVGLILIVAVLAPPFVAAVRARSAPYVPFAFAAFAAWCAHAGLDWDWELVGVSAAALLSGAGIVVAARARERPVAGLARGASFSAALVLAVVAATAVLSNARLESAQAALGRGDTGRALLDAERARRLSPWSVRPFELIASARLDEGRTESARGAYREIVRRDPESWIAWTHLAELSSGSERAHALATARRLKTGYEGSRP